MSAHFLGVDGNIEAGQMDDTAVLIPAVVVGKQPQTVHKQTGVAVFQ